MARMVMMVLCVLMTCMVMSAPYTEATITCNQVIRDVIPCMGYLALGGAMPSAGCCNGVKELNNAAKSTPDRQTTCNCLKSAYSASPAINSANAASLPGKCGVNIPYKISPSTDCSKVK